MKRFMVVFDAIFKKNGEEAKIYGLSKEEKVIVRKTLAKHGIYDVKFIKREIPYEVYGGGACTPK